LIALYCTVENGDRDLVKMLQKEETKTSREAPNAPTQTVNLFLLPPLPFLLYIGRAQGFPCFQACSQNQSIYKIVIRKNFINILEGRRLSRLHKPLQLGKIKQETSGEIVPLL
jgi:hypothetical protein